MLLAPIIEGLQEDLTAAAAVGGDENRRVAELLVAAVGPAMRLRLMEALQSAAEELEASLARAALVEIRLVGRDPVLSLVEAPEADHVGGPTAEGASTVAGATGGAVTAGAGADSGSEPEAESGVARVTLRMPESLKVQSEVAAAQAGASLNHWLVNAAAQALRMPPGPRRGPRRVTGFVRG